MKIGLCTALLALRTAHAETRTVDAKNETVGTALSVAGTLVPAAAAYGVMTGRDTDAMIGLAVFGAAVGPSLGEWYAGRYLTVGLGLRLAGIVTTTLGAMSSIDVERNSDGARTGSPVPMIAGLTLVAAGTVYDIATAGRAVRAHNREHTFDIAPGCICDGTQTTPSVVAAGTF